MQEGAQWGGACVYCQNILLSQVLWECKENSEEIQEAKSTSEFCNQPRGKKFQLAGSVCDKTGEVERHRSARTHART